MPLGKTSNDRLDTCHPRLQQLIRRVMQGVDEGDLEYAGITDITVLCGFRGEAEQNKAVADGASQLPWPKSAHNQQPSWAVDVAPFPIDWKDTRKFEVLHSYIAGVAHAMLINLYDISWDRPHIQLARP